MKSRFPEETTIRRYLLGQLDTQQELEESLSEEMLFNDELSEMVDAIEDEIIEEYLDGTLDVDDKRSFRNYFMQPPERKEKLRFAQLLRQHFNSPGDAPDLAQKIPAPVRGGQLGRPDVVVIGHWQAHARAYLELAALMVLTISSVLYIGWLQRSLAQNAKASIQRENELKQERERSASLSVQLQAALRPPEALTLTPIHDRGPGQLQQAEIGPTTQRISVSLILKSNSAPAYQVHLKNPEGKEIWSQELYPLISSSHGPQLAFDIPVEGISDGKYTFVVTPRLRSGSISYHYTFVSHSAK